MKKQKTNAGTSLDSLARNAEQLFEGELRAIKGGASSKPEEEEEITLCGGALAEVVITATPLPKGSSGGGISFGYSGGSFGMGGFASSFGGSYGTSGYSGYGSGDMGSAGGGGSSHPSGGGSYSSNVGGTPKPGKEWLEPISTVNGVVGVVASAVENIPELVSTVFKSISQIQVANVGKAGGALTFGLGTGLDAIGVYNYYTNGQNSPNSITPPKFGINLGVGAIGLFGAPGAIVGGMYFGLEKFYPGGTMGAINKNADLTKKNQEILGSNWNLNRDY